MAFNSKAALVIGLNYVGGHRVPGLGKLKAAIDCAKDVENWLAPEFDIELLTDADGDVTVHNIKSAMRRFFGGPNEQTYQRYRMLVLYFAGHGVDVNRSDHWVLNLAGEDTGESINVKETRDAARRCGIPNVVILSDACRQDNALPRALMALTGTQVLPLKDPDGQRDTKVDIMRAARIGREAWEMKSGTGRGFSIFSRALIQATRSPKPAWISEVPRPPEPVRCVTNRTLNRHLQTEVDAVLSELRVTASQRISMEVPSDDDVYMRVLDPPETSPTSPVVDVTDFGMTWDIDLLHGSELSYKNDGWAGAAAQSSAGLAKPVENKRKAPKKRTRTPDTTPTLRKVRGIGKATETALIKAGIETVADLADASQAQLNAADSHMPGLALKAQQQGWQYEARGQLEAAGARLPVARMAAANLSIGRGDGLPETGGAGSTDMRNTLSKLCPDANISDLPADAFMLWRGPRVTEAFLAGLGQDGSLTAHGADVTGQEDTPDGAATSLLRHAGRKAIDTCFVQFDDGRATLLPVLAGYVALGVVDTVGVQSYRMAALGFPMSRIQQAHDLNANLTLALDPSVGGFDADGNFARITNDIEILRQIDPMLTLLGTAVLNSLGRAGDMARIRTAFDSPGAPAESVRPEALFDLALLARFNHADALPETARTPCPALTENWNYITSRDARAHASTEGGRAGLLPSLWTCFEPETARTLRHHLQEGT